MSTIEINHSTQELTTTLERKNQFGEVFTPFSIIEEMIDAIPLDIVSSPTTTWLDPASGTGYYPMVIFNRLMSSPDLIKAYPSLRERRSHIWREQLRMCEINPENLERIRKNCAISKSEFKGKFCSAFSPPTDTTTLFSTDFFELDREKLFQPNGFDIIIGNPPYNVDGNRKVPTNSHQKKKNDGRTVWMDFIHHSLSLLKDGGFLSMIVPSLWLKQDKAKMYHTLLQWDITHIRSFSNTETTLIFKNQAQTPVCWFVLRKRHVSPLLHPRMIRILGSGYHGLRENTCDFTPQWEEYRFKKGMPIPMRNIGIIRELMPSLEKYGSLGRRIRKTNMPRNDIELSQNPDELHPYPAIKSCLLTQRITDLNKKGLDRIPAKLSLQWSNKPCRYLGVSKIVMPHKMYGIPFFDRTGMYGISNRDNYVLSTEEGFSLEDLERIHSYLQLPMIQAIFDSTRYRMRYLEKYAFEFIPDITHPACSLEIIQKVFDTIQKKYGVVMYYPCYYYPDTLLNTCLNNPVE